MSDDGQLADVTRTGRVEQATTVMVLGLQVRRLQVRHQRVRLGAFKVLMLIALPHALLALPRLCAEAQDTVLISIATTTV